MEQIHETKTIKRPTPLFTADEIARLYNVSCSTVYRLSAQEIIPCIRLGRAVRFDPDAVLRALVEHREQMEK